MINTYKLTSELVQGIEKNEIKTKILVKFLLETMDYTFKVKDIKSKELTKENVYNELRPNQLYDNNNETIKKITLDIYKKELIVIS